MVKLTYLSAAFVATAMSLLPAVHCSPVDATPTNAIPATASSATSDLPAGTKAEPNGTAGLIADVTGVVNAYSSQSTILEQAILLRPEVCERLPGTTAEVTWKKYPGSRVTIHEGTPDFCDCTGASLYFPLEDTLYLTTPNYWCIKISF